MKVSITDRTFVLMSLSALFVLSASAFGIFTPVFQPPDPGEENHQAILGDIYGGGTYFIGGGIYLGNGMWSEYVSADDSITAFRIDDDDDQIWSLDSAVAAKAKYAGMNQSFGWDEGAWVGGPPLNETDYQELLTDADIGGASVAVNTGGTSFLWGIKPSGIWSDFLWWSNVSFNPDQRDHMVTYRIEGLDTDDNVYLLFFEDLPASPASFRPRYATADWDYNDFVVEVSQLPEPASIIVLGLGAFASLFNRHKKQFSEN